MVNIIFKRAHPQTFFFVVIGAGAFANKGQHHDIEKTTIKFLVLHINCGHTPRAHVVDALCFSVYTGHHELS